jgi:hypothetical protein
VDRNNGFIYKLHRCAWPRRPINKKALRSRRARCGATPPY